MGPVQYGSGIYQDAGVVDVCVSDGSSLIVSFSLSFVLCHSTLMGHQLVHTSLFI